jgi:hypothetical protein
MRFLINPRPNISTATLPESWRIIRQPSVRQFLVIVVLINAVGGGGDLAASVIVARQVPRGGEIGIWNGRACWKNP